MSAELTESQLAALRGPASSVTRTDLDAALRAYESLTAELGETSELLRSTTKAHDEYEAELEAERAAHEQTKADRDEWRTAARDNEDAHEQTKALMQRDCDEYREGVREAQLAQQAAESALATARKLLEDWMRGDDPLVWAKSDAFLSSRPAPVAAPCAGCAAHKLAYQEALRDYRKLVDAIDAAIARLDAAAGPNFIGRALSALRAARSKP